MKINADSLASQLEKKFAPIYLISGDEHLLVEEACDLIRKKSFAKDYTERQIFHAEKKFNWNDLRASVDTLSLFNDKALIELRMPTGKANEVGKKVLLQYAANPSEDKILLIITKKIDAATQKTKWFKAIEQAGIFVQVWPVNHQQLPIWLTKRLKQHNLTAEAEAINFLADNTEGNLLAAKQEIEKLALIYDEKHLSLDEVIDAISNNARFDVFTLADCMLGADTKRSLRILRGLKDEGIEPTLVLWALTREIRGLASMAQELQQGASVDNVFYKYRVWEKRKPLVRLGLKRHNTKSLLKLLEQASQIDRVIKGQQRGNVWDELESLTLNLCFTSNNSFL